MIKSKDGEVKIKGKTTTIRDELCDLIRGMYWKKITSAEDLLLITVKAILEAEKLDEEDEEEDED